VPHARSDGWFLSLPGLYRAIDQHCQVIDVLLDTSRNQAAPDGPGSMASQAIKEQALPISGGHADAAHHSPDPLCAASGVVDTVVADM
jgi:hypothetical protein